MPRNIQSKPIDRAIGDIVKGYAKTMGRTQDDIAETAGIPLVTVQRLFAGKSSWNSSQMLEIANAIGGPKTADILFREAIDFLPHLRMSGATDSNVLPFNPRTATADELDRNAGGDARAAHPFEEEGDQPDD